MDNITAGYGLGIHTFPHRNEETITPNTPEGAINNLEQDVNRYKESVDENARNTVRASVNYTINWLVKIYTPLVEQYIKANYMPKIGVNEPQDMVVYMLQQLKMRGM